MAEKIRGWKLVIALMLGCIAGVMTCGIHEVSAATYGDYECEVLSDGTVEITKYNKNIHGTFYDVVLPDMIDGKPVSSIGEYAFYDCGSMRSITIPSSVRNIGKYAFGRCLWLSSINIPDGVTSISEGTFIACGRLVGIEIPDSVTNIGDSAFFACDRLVSIEIPISVTNIGNDAFSFCTSLASVQIPSSVTNIRRGTFCGCTALKSVEIPDSVTTIEDYAFFDCSSLTAFNIPKSVTRIEWQVLSGCSALDSIVVDSANTVYDSRDNCNAIIESSSNRLISGCRKTVIPNSVTSIGECAFEKCSSLISIDIPNSVKSIKGGAFNSCSSLTSIKIPNGVTSIEAGLFYKCSSLTSVQIPKGVISIGDSAFKECSSLTDINLPDSLTKIEQDAFQDCSSLTSITIPNGVEVIEWFTFAGCSSLKTVKLSDNLRSIGWHAFFGCNLTSIKIPESVTDIIDDAFYNCPKNMVIYVVKGSYAEKWAKKSGFKYELYDSKSLPKVGTKYIVSNGVYKVTKSSDDDKEVTFTKPKDSKKTSVTIPATIKIDGYTYNVTQIAPKAFKNNKKLKSVTIGKKVKTIGKEAFSGCSKLNKITIKSTVLKTVGKNAIKGIKAKATIKCPQKQISSYKGLFTSKTGYKKSMKIKK